MEENKVNDYSSSSGYQWYCTPVGIRTSEISKAKHKDGVKRFVGVDLSKQNCWACIMDLQGKVILHEKFSLRSAKRDKLYEMLQPGDLVLMEASTGTFNIARAMNRKSGVVACVINPHTTHINETKKKTDREDSLFLARLILRTPIAELQLVSIPSDREMANRDVVSHYRKLDDVHKQMVNRLHALFFDNGFPEAGKMNNLHSKLGREAAIESCFGTDRAYAFPKRIAKDLSKELSLLEELQESGEKQFARIVKQDDRTATLLGSIPGVGLKTIATFIAFVGDVDRFCNAKQLAAYCGLVPRVYQSGQKDAARKITKEGQAALREYLIESVFAMTKTHFDFPLKRKFNELRLRMGGRKAAVAIARKMVVMMYSMLKNGTLFTVEDEQERQEVAAYHARKHLPILGRYNQIRQSCKGFEEMIEITNSMTINELGVFKFLNQGA
ncbi:IS110 family transposase [uncultured Sphaerochaeta sp.]|uniref:IS110 family transposase n=1 Tax=uncultured Sphaerochaeta sp. TaxID=886478 RepID=UPI0029CA981B|nr:IS110 family transposase [uncultured Sphaerochaeta sp.]